MSTLGKAIILFGVDTAMFRGDVGRTVHIFEQGVNRMQRIAFGFRGAIAGGLTAGGMVLFTKSVIDSADELAKLSQRTGISVQRLSELRLAAELGNVSNEQFAVGLREWNKTLVEATNSSSKAAKVLKALGVDITAGPYESLRQFAEAFSKLPEGELRTAAATAILKKAGDAWIPTLAAGTKGLDEAAKKAHELGLVISDEFAAKAERFNDNWKLITKSMTGFANVALESGVLEFLDGLSERLEKAARKGSLLKGIWEELKLFDAVTGAYLFPNDPHFQGKLDDPQVRAMLEGRLAAGRIRGATGGEVKGQPVGMFRPSPEELRAALADTDALQKRQVAALQQMEQKKKSLFDLNEQELMLERIKTGTFKDFDAETKVRLLNLALEIDLRKELIDRIDLGMKAAEADFEARERGAEIYRDFALAGRAQLEQLQLETELVGVNVREQEKVNAVRALELDLLERKRRAASAYGEDVAGLMLEVARLDGEAARQRANVLRSIDERQAKERDWLVGAKIGFDEYGDAATNAAANARDAVVSSFQNMEDAMVRWVRTGKLSSRDLANAILDDLARIAIRQTVTGPAANMFLNMLNGGGGEIGTGMTTGSEVGPWLANGGVMSSRGLLPLRRYSRGGIANSPQLAVFGEGSSAEAFVPLPDGRRIPVALEGGAGGGMTVNMPIYFSANTPAAVRDAVFALAPQLEERVKQSYSIWMRRGNRP